jgi:hypothetical protein
MVLTERNIAMTKASDMSDSAFDALKPAEKVEPKKRDGRGHYAGFNTSALAKCILAVLARNKTYKVVFEMMVRIVGRIVLLNNAAEPTFQNIVPLMLSDEIDDVCSLFPADADAIKACRKA